MIFVALALHSLLAPTKLYSVETLIAAALALRRYHTAGGDLDAINSAAVSGGPPNALERSGVPAIVRAFLRPDAEKTFSAATNDVLAAASDDDDASGLHDVATQPSSCCGLRFSALRDMSPALRWYMASICILAAYIGVNVSLSDSTPGSGKYLCLITTASVILIDLSVVAMWMGGLLRSTGEVAVVSTAARIALIAYGTRYWLLGQCTVYAVIGIFLAHTLAVQRFASSAKIVTFRSLLGLGPTPNEPRNGTTQPSIDARATSGAAAPAVPGAPQQQASSAHCPWMTDALKYLFHPAGLLLSMTVVFTIFIAGLAVAMDRNSSTVPGDAVPTFTSYVAQYAFGVGALCVVAIWLFSELTVRLWWRGRRSFTLVGWGCALASWVVCAVSGGVLSGLTSSYAILACGVFVPPLAISLMYGYGRWLKDDYVCFLPGGFDLQKLYLIVRHLNANSESLSEHAKRNWAMVFCIVAVFAALCGFGATISGTVSYVLR